MIEFPLGKQLGKLRSGMCYKKPPNERSSMLQRIPSAVRRLVAACAALVCALSLVFASPAVFAQATSLAEAADRAVAQSKLTVPGSTPFQLKAKIAEKDNRDSDFKADVEIFWESPEKWRRVIISPDFSQTMVVNGDKIWEEDKGDYYPFWLHELVTAMIDPLPMLEALEKSNGQIAAKAPAGFGLAQTCARFQVQVGVPPVQNSAFYVFCFESDHRLLESVVTPQYSVEFKDYRNFKQKRVPRLLVTDPEPGTTIEAKITDLEELKNADESIFAISESTPSDRQLKSQNISEGNLRSIALQNPDVVWPSVRAGKTSGVLTLYVSVDRSGRVRETFPLNADNPALQGAAREQVQKWRFKPATADGMPVQVESTLTFAFDTKIENPIPVLSDAEARKLATNTVEAEVPAESAASGASFTVRVTVDTDGKLTGVTNTNNLSTPLFGAAYKALTQWHFRPYLRDGKPDVYAADITFRVP